MISHLTPLPQGPEVRWREPQIEDLIAAMDRGGGLALASLLVVEVDGKPAKFDALRPRQLRTLGDVVAQRCFPDAEAIAAMRDSYVEDERGLACTLPSGTTIRLREPTADKVIASVEALRAGFGPGLRLMVDSIAERDGKPVSAVELRQHPLDARDSLAAYRALRDLLDPRPAETAAALHLTVTSDGPGQTTTP